MNLNRLRELAGLEPKKDIFEADVKDKQAELAKVKPHVDSMTELAKSHGFEVTNKWGGLGSIYRKGLVFVGSGWHDDLPEGTGHAFLHIYLNAYDDLNPQGNNRMKVKKLADEMNSKLAPFISSKDEVSELHPSVLRIENS